MFRKRRQPAPFFNMPGAPFNPTTGENASLGTYPPRGTTLAMFQVVEEDTHDNYVVCRGYEADSDPNFRFLHDPYTVPTTTPINVAKPYALRGTNPYELGQVIVAARIKGKLGFNQGKAAATVGQPADLDEVVELLLDDDDVSVAWMDIGGIQGSPTLLGKADVSILNGFIGAVSIWDGVAGAEADTTENVTATVRGAAVVQGQWVRVHFIDDDWYIIELTNEQLGKPDSDIYKGASGIVSIWNGVGGAEVDSGINVTAWAKGVVVRAGKFAVLGNMNGVWYVAPWEL